MSDKELYELLEVMKRGYDNLRKKAREEIIGISSLGEYGCGVYLQVAFETAKDFPYGSAIGGYKCIDNYHMTFMVDGVVYVAVGSEKKWRGTSDTGNTGNIAS